MGALTGGLLAALLIFAAHPANAAVTARIQAGTLKIVGDAADNKLALALASPTSIAVDVGEDGSADFTFDRSTFTAIDVQAAGGDDEVRILNGLTEPTTVNGGPGNDTLLGGSEPDLLLGGAGDDFVDGNIGNDTAQLGNGADVFQWDPGDGSDIVDGQGGDDRLAFNGSNIGEKIDVSANGGRIRFARDVAAINMDLDGIEHVGFRALGGSDTVTVGDLAGTDAKTVDVDLNGFGGTDDGSPDTVVVNGTGGADQVKLTNADGALVVGGLAAQTRVTGGETALDNVDVATLAGDDTLTATVGVTGSAQVTFDGGEGQDTTRFNGTSADDQIGIAANAGPSAATFSPGGVDREHDRDHGEPRRVRSRRQRHDHRPERHRHHHRAHDRRRQRQRHTRRRRRRRPDPRRTRRRPRRRQPRHRPRTARRRRRHVPVGSRRRQRHRRGPGRRRHASHFNGSNIGEKIDVSANGSRVRLARDVAAIVMDFDGIEHVGIRTLGGADTVTVGDLAGTAAKTVDVDLSAFDGSGDAAADRIVVLGTDERGQDRSSRTRTARSSSAGSPRRRA